MARTFDNAEAIREHLTSRRVELVEFPEYDAAFYVGVMTGSERDAYENEQVSFSMVGNKPTPRVDLKNARSKLVVRVLCNQAGQRVYKDDDIAKVGAMPGDLLDKLFDAARRINALEDQAVDIAMGNSESGPQDDSGSD